MLKIPVTDGFRTLILLKSSVSVLLQSLVFCNKWVYTGENSGMRGEITSMKEKPVVKAENAHFLKGHASWLYCDQCKKTVAYLCYVTYRYFHFSFVCSCGSQGLVENKYGDIDLLDLPTGKLERNRANKRYCCAKDQAALFSPVPKNLRSYRAEIVCRDCNTRYEVREEYAPVPCL